MRFALTEEQTQLGQTARKLLAGAGEYPPSGLDRRLLGTLGGLDLLGLPVPERRGGAGAGVVELCVLAEQVGAALPAVPFASGTVFATLLLSEVDNPVATELLGKLVSGAAAATVAWRSFAEPFGCAEQTETHTGVPFGAEADILLVGGPDAVRVFDLAEPGVRREPVAGFDFSEPPAVITVDGVRPLCTVEAPVNRVLPAVLSALAAELIGTGQRALDDAVAYAKQREQFGRAIGSFQAIKHLLADRHVQLDAASGLVHYAAWACDNDEPDAALAAHTALAAAAEAAITAAADNLQTHGGIGFTWEQSAHRYLRRTRARRAMFGTHARQLDRIADYILPESTGERATPLTTMRA